MPITTHHLPGRDIGPAFRSINMAEAYALKVEPLRKILIRGMKVKVEHIVPGFHARISFVPLAPGDL